MPFFNYQPGLKEWRELLSQGSLLQNDDQNEARTFSILNLLYFFHVTEGALPNLLKGLLTCKIMFRQSYMLYPSSFLKF